MSGTELPWRPRSWLVIALAVTGLGLLSSSIVVTSRLATADEPMVGFSFLMEMTGAWSALALLPALVWFIRRFPVTRATWWRRLPLHVAGSVVFGVCHTLLMWGSREAAYRLLGWGGYEYGRMGYRFVMEYHKQALIYAAVYGLVAFAAYAERNRRRELRAAELERQLSEARLEALKSQLNPHFLFNALNTISTAVHEDPEAADAMLGHLARFLRMTLRQSSHEVSFETELEFADAYLAIMRARLEDGLEVEVEVPAPVRGALVPHLLLQPLVENAVRHGTSSAGLSGRVRIAAERRDGRLGVVVEDNGPGLGGGGGRDGGGVGLANTAARLRELYGADHRLEVADRAGGGVRVTVEIPWRGTGEETAT